MRLEQKVAVRNRREQIQQKITLAIFRMTTRSSRLAFAPREVLLRRLYPELAKGGALRRVRQALRRLEKRGLVQWERGPRGWATALTPKGEAYAKKMHAAERIKLHTPEQWDGKWRIVIFDVWERRRGVRDKLRETLKRSGFKKLQASVWVSPYDCEDLVVFLRVELRLGKALQYLIADIENDAELRSLFRLRG